MSTETPTIDAFKAVAAEVGRTAERLRTALQPAINAVRSWWLRYGELLQRLARQRRRAVRRQQQLAVELRRRDRRAARRHRQASSVRTR